MILTPAEVELLTGRARSDAQRRALDFMGVPYLVRPDKSLAVLRAALEHQPGATIKPREPELLP